MDLIMNVKSQITFSEFSSNSYFFFFFFQFHRADPFFSADLSLYLLGFVVLSIIPQYLEQSRNCSAFSFSFLFSFLNARFVGPS